MLSRNACTTQTPVLQNADVELSSRISWTHRNAGTKGASLGIMEAGASGHCTTGFFSAMSKPAAKTS